MTKRLNIKFDASVAHPQTNRLAEVTNRTILQGVKKRLDSEGKLDRRTIKCYGLKELPREKQRENPHSLYVSTWKL